MLYRPVMCLSTVVVVLTAALSAHANFAFPCRTPNHEAAFCISLFSCPILMRGLGSLDPTAIEFVKKSICCDTVPWDLLVCCGTQGNFEGANVTITLETATQAPLLTTTETTQPPVTATTPTEDPFEAPYTSIPYEQTEDYKIEVHREFVKKKLLPSRKYCGYQHTDDRFYTDNATALDEFPWLTHVVFLEDEDDDPYQFLDRCNGVLINRRYVLTAEFCGSEATSVRLGQYYTNQTVACIDNPNFPECTEARVEIEVEEEVHRVENTTAWHEFILLRLAKNVTYTDFIRPICLPLNEPARPEVFTFSGWGGTENVGAVKKRLSYKPISVDKCYELDEQKLKEAKNLTVVCLEPEKPGGELACTGDEAGPLMYSQNHQWFVDSLITSVYYQSAFDDDNRCSNEHPIGGLKLTDDVLDWIIDSIRP